MMTNGDLEGRAAVRFYLTQGLVRLCEIEISHIGKNNKNPNLVWENICALTWEYQQCGIYTKVDIQAIAAFF